MSTVLYRVVFAIFIVFVLSNLLNEILQYHEAYAKTDLQYQSISTPQKQAIVTYLRGEGKYLAGTIALTESAQLAHSNDDNIDIVVVAHESVSKTSRRILEKLGNRVIVVADAEFDNAALPRPDSWRIAMQKYVFLSLTAYQKIIFVDSDAIILKPLYELFGQPSLSMRADCGPDRYNSGVIVIEPKPALWENFQAFVNLNVSQWPEQERDKARRSSQRIFGLFVDSVEGLAAPQRLCEGKRLCKFHTFYHELGCDLKSFEARSQAEIVHFMASGLDIIQWAKANLTSPITPTWNNNAQFCGQGLAGKWREYYFTATHRLGFVPPSANEIDAEFERTVGAKE